MLSDPIELEFSTTHLGVINKLLDAARLLLLTDATRINGLLNERESPSAVPDGCREVADDLLSIAGQMLLAVNGLRVPQAYDRDRLFAVLSLMSRGRDDLQAVSDTLDRNERAVLQASLRTADELLDRLRQNPSH